MEKRDQWYKLTDDEAAQSLVTLARRLRDEQSGRQSDRIFYAALYGWREAATGFSSALRADLVTSTQTNRLSLNLTRTMVDAAVARIAALAQPKATFYTDGAEYAKREQAQQMDKALQGIFDQEKYRAKSLRAFRSALVFSEGWLWFEADHVWGKPRIVRTLPGEVFVDEREALTGVPPRIYRRRYYDRAQLAAAFPKAAEQIEEAKPLETDEREWGFDPQLDQVLVTEGWSLPSGPKAKDGRYIAAIEGATLEMMPYTRNRFPGARYVWDDPEVGWYGHGLVEELAGIQIEINDLLDQINEAHQVVAGKWLVERNSGVERYHITDERDGILVYRGTAPTYITPNAVPPQMYEYLWRLVSQAYEITGISQLAATSQKPAGLNSGVAIRAYEDNQSSRFKHKLSGFEDFVCDSAKLTIDAVQDLAEKGDVRVRSITDDEMSILDWKSVALDEEAYEVRVNPTSTLPQTTAGKLALVSDLAAVVGSDGQPVMDPQELSEMMAGIPDVEAYLRGKSGTKRLVKKAFAQMAAGKRAQGPEPEMDPVVSLAAAKEEYLTYRAANVPPDRLDEMLRWINLAARIAAPPPPPAPEPMPMPGPEPMGPGPGPEPMMEPAPDGAPPL